MADRREGTAEQALVPLLDVVMQLLMFFMMCVNFVSEQVNEDVKLPQAQSARPMDKRLGDVLVLNMDAKGRLLVPGRPKPLTTPLEFGTYLRQEYADAKRNAEARKEKSDGISTVVIVRAHRDSNYANVFGILRLCKEVGFRKLQLRALTQGGEG